MKKWFPWIVLALVLGWLGASSVPPKDKVGLGLQEFGRLPSLLNGRSQPLDSVARNSLLVLRGKQTVPTDQGKTLSAIEWFAEATLNGDLADTRQVFRIDHPELRGLLKLRGEDKFFSLEQLRPGLLELGKEADRLQETEVKPEQQTPFEKAVVKLHGNVILYRRLKNSIQPEQVADFQAELKAFQDAIPAGLTAAREQQAGKPFDQSALDQIVSHLQKYDLVRKFAYPLIIPSGSPDHNRDDWANIGTVLMEAPSQGQIPVPVSFYATMSSAYRAGDATKFNEAVKGYQEWLSEHHYAPEIAKGRNEHYFNFLEPFYKASCIYVLIFILACISWFNNSVPFRRAAFGLLVLTLVLHTTGLIYRMVLEGRPPVTNLYSSAIFIGWGICVLGLLLEAFYKNAIGTVVASMGGFTTLIVAHNLALGGDTMEMMRAVLDTNFWLATHVVAVTLGYSSTFLAGFLAILYVLRGSLTTSLTSEMARSLSRMVYGIVCFAMLFSFVGTVLGGIWADQSWGRFWGWDPKENGALMIVIWNAFYLHARWGKVFSERGLMAVAIFGNVITAFSWFGVNMLGIGLHSYGFMDSAFRWLILFDISQLLILVLALVPIRFWRSKPPAPSSTAPPAPVFAK